jgi:hypothetical protein
MSKPGLGNAETRLSEPSLALTLTVPPTRVNDLSAEPVVVEVLSGAVVEVEVDEVAPSVVDVLDDPPDDAPPSVVELEEVLPALLELVDDPRDVDELVSPLLEAVEPESGDVTSVPSASTAKTGGSLVWLSAAFTARHATKVMAAVAATQASTRPARRIAQVSHAPAGTTSMRDQGVVKPSTTVGNPSVGDSIPR